ncbi:MAG: vWA domain-containing protein, partial [Thermoguttaceae bacterium]
VESEGNRNKQVSLRELYGYLKAKVSQWVTQNRDDLQEPILLPENAPDVPLVFRRSDEGTVMPPPGERDPRWDQMAELWKQHSALRTKAPYREKPLEWADFQFNLLRAEQLLEAGSAYEGEFNKTVVWLAGQASALGEAAKSPEAVPYSLALAEQWHRLPSEQELIKLPAPWLPGAKPAESGQVEEKKPVAAKDNVDYKAADAKSTGKEPAAGAVKEVPAAKPGDKQATAAAEKPPAPEARPRPYKYWPAAVVAWERALEHHDTADEVKQALAFVDGANGQPRDGSNDDLLKADIVEVQFLRMLAAHLDAKVWNRPDLLRRALSSRQMAERAVASPDLSDQYWIHNLVDGADQDRRLAEDKLYVGSPEALQQAESLWEKLAAEDGNGGKYREAISRAQTISKALALRDQAWAEGPYLAQCLLARLAVGKPDAQELRTFLQKTEKLAALLDDSTADEKWPDELPRATTLLVESQKKLTNAYDDECIALGTAADDANALRRILAVVATPLITGDERNELRKKCLGIMFSPGKQDATATGAARPETQGLGQDWWKRLVSWEEYDEYPALTLLNLGAVAAREKKLKPKGPEDVMLRLAAQGGDARAALEALPMLVDKGFQQTRSAEKTRARAAAIRGGCCQAERALRASAALFAVSENQIQQNVQDDPIAELHRIDLRSLLLWQANRVMADFWGPKPGMEKPSYFEIVARDYLRRADKLNVVKLKDELADLPEAQELQALVEAAKKDVVQPKVNPAYLLVDKPNDEIPQNMKVDVGEGLPPGEAALFLESSRGPLATVLRENHEPWRRLWVEVKPIKDRPLPEYLITKDLAGSDWHATALYRGHVRTAPFSFVPMHGVEIVYKPVTPRTAKISVFGESKQGVGIMFIFDCSGSMDDHVVKSDKTTPKKIDVARDALCEVLDTLAEAGKNACHAGLIAYGHRVGFQLANGNLAIVARGPNKQVLLPVAALIPQNPALANLNPNTDMEVFDLNGGVLAPLTPNRVQGIKGQLGRLNPLGETPLYRAIWTAAEELNKVAGLKQKHIIVLTDGANDQYNEAVVNPALQVFDTCEQLREKLNDVQNKSTHLDIVGFQIDPNEDRREYDKMQGLATELKVAGRGGYHPANNLKELLSELRKSLALNKYEVLNATTMAQVKEPLDLNQLFEFDPLTPGSYQVRLVDDRRPATAEIELKGGEWLQLTLGQTPRGWGFVHKQYRLADEDWVQDSCDGVKDPTKSDRTFWIGAHKPEWVDSGWEFYVSVQNDDETSFSPRPSEAWVEITPVGQPTGPDEHKKWLFYDMSFKPDWQVPVLCCRCLGWPKEAKEAEIEFWCRFRGRSREEEEVTTLGKLSDLRLSEAPKVRFEVKKGTEGSSTIIEIDELHPRRDDIYQLKVELEKGTIGAAKAVEIDRLFVDPKAGDQAIVRHKFILDGNPRPEDLDLYVVRVASKERLKKDAVTLKKKLHVTIQR